LTAEKVRKIVQRKVQKNREILQKYISQSFVVGGGEKKVEHLLGV
jgi:hypothetical protein